MNLLIIITIAILFWNLLGKKTEGFSPGTIVELHPSHQKKYGDYSHLNNEDYGAAKLGPLAPMHVLKAQNPNAEDPCFKEFDIPFTLDSLDSFSEVTKPLSNISTNMV